MIHRNLSIVWGECNFFSMRIVCLSFISRNRKRILVYIGAKHRVPQAKYSRAYAERSQWQA